MKLLLQGMMTEQCWKEIPNHFKNIEMDTFVVMANHIHGILVVYGNPAGTRYAVSLQEQFGTMY